MNHKITMNTTTTTNTTMRIRIRSKVTKDKKIKAWWCTTAFGVQHEKQLRVVSGANSKSPR